MKNSNKTFFAAQAWVQGTWASNVLLSVDVAGLWSGVQTDVPQADRKGATVLDSPVLPGLVNAHSHAFQRAMAGLTERIGPVGVAASDDFWSWRDAMYRLANRITPDQLEAIAAFLYAELLANGYTQVCEFHYLHNAVDGRPYADPLEMSLALVRAAQRVGMGLTLLPALYRRSGFDAGGLREDQRRFACTPDGIAHLVESVQRQTQSAGAVNVGVALHSLRAVEPAAVKELAAFAAAAALPVHIHISEQTQEVDDCLAHTGQRPVEWLMDHLAVNRHWNLVHATHTTPAELRAVAGSGASVVICPSTEANLGDGVFDYPGLSAVGGNWSIGSDSHVTRCWTQELRLLEYSQRLTVRRRNVAAVPGGAASTAAALFEGALAGGRAASGQPLGGIAIGNRADFLVLDSQSNALVGVPDDHVLDALVFSSPDAGFKQVFVAGQAVSDGQPDLELAWQFAQVMKGLSCL